MQHFKSIAMAVCACLLLSTSSFGQMKVKDRVEANKIRFEKMPSKKPLKKTARIPRGLDVVKLKNPVVLSLDGINHRGIKNNNFEILKLEIPLKDKSLKLKLVKAHIFGPDFKVKQASNPNANTKIDIGQHYWGIVDGDLNSIVSLSVYDDQLAGIITTKGQTYNLGKLEASNYHVIHEENKEEHSPLGCHVDKDKHNFGQDLEIKTTKSLATGNCVGIYVETAYDMFQNKGSVTNVVNYVTSVFAQVSALYANEEINLFISELWIWNVNDPYTANDPGAYLDSFRDLLNSSNSHNPDYNGSLAHLLSFDVLGGVAYVNVVCNRSYGYGFSGISKSYAAQPAYSWTVEVITHELGHNLGSPHTHDCSWNGNNTAIDGCGPVAGYESGCNGPLPSGGGTIMSYCHLTNIGIDFTLGFGQQPGDLIRYRIQNARCLTTCSSTCDIVGTGCNDNDPCTSFDTIDDNCDCVGIFADSDNDGVCDADDLCPNSNDGLDVDNDGIPDGCDDCIVGSSCNDGSTCTTNDTIDANCNCTGTLIDSDGDGVCDSDDKCPGSDDRIDTDNDGIPDGCDACANTGSPCDDGNACTSNDTVNENCGCEGILIDNDSDGVCKNEDPDDNNACIPNACNTCPVINQNNFDVGFGSWSDGGSDAAVVTTNAYSGAYSLRLRDNSSSSIATSPAMDLSSSSELNISFTFVAQSMEYGEDFWLQLSTDGGTNFTTVADFNSGTDFSNNTREFVDMALTGVFSTNTKVRFRCDASNNSDIIYIDDFLLTACGGTTSGSTCIDGVKNGNETGIDCGGTDCAPCDPTCNDGIKNGNETGVDCGGACSPCPTSCEDGIKNGDETGVDCGGSNCQPCVTSGCNSIANDNFESGWGIWNDGGADATRASQSTYANSGIYSLMIKDNTSSSVVFTDNLDLRNYGRINISFTYITRSMDNSSEDFWLEISTNGGASYTRIEEWNLGDEFVNNRRENELITIAGPFSNNTKLRFKCDASANNDMVYLDDINIEACVSVPSLVTDDSQLKRKSKSDKTLIDNNKSEKSSGLKIFPNPIANGENVNIKINVEMDRAKVFVMDLDGRNVLSMNVDKKDYNKIELPTSDLSSGTYLIYVKSDETLLVEKLIILR